MSPSESGEDFFQICKDGDVDRYARLVGSGQHVQMNNADDDGFTGMYYCLKGHNYAQARRLVADFGVLAVECIGVELQKALEVQAKNTKSNEQSRLLTEIRSVQTKNQDVLGETSSSDNSSTSSTSSKGKRKRSGDAASPSEGTVSEKRPRTNPYNKKDSLPLLSADLLTAFDARDEQRVAELLGFVKGCRDELGNTVLHYLFKEYIANSDGSVEPGLLLLVNFSGKNVLHMMCEAGDYASISKLMVRDRNMFAQTDDLGNTALHYLVSHTSGDPVHIDCAALLLKDLLHVENKQRMTPLHIALKNDNTRFLNKIREVDRAQLVSRALEVTGNGVTAAHYACEAGNEEIFKRLIGNYSSKNSPAMTIAGMVDSTGETLVSWVIRHTRMHDNSDRERRVSFLKFLVNELKANTSKVHGVSMRTLCLLHGLPAAVVLFRGDVDAPLTSDQMEVILENRYTDSLAVFLDERSAFEMEAFQRLGRYYKEIDEKKRSTYRLEQFALIEDSIARALKSKENKVSIGDQKAVLDEKTKLHATSKAQSAASPDDSDKLSDYRAATAALQEAQRDFYSFDLGFMFKEHKMLGCSFVWLIARMGLPTVLHRLSTLGDSAGLPLSVTRTTSGTKEKKDVVSAEPNPREAILLQPGRVDQQRRCSSGDSLLAACCLADSSTSITISGLDVVKYINVPNKTGDTPLHLLMRRGCSKDSWLAIKAISGLNWTAENKLKETPLMAAIQHGDIHQFKALEAEVDKYRKAVVITKDNIDSVSAQDQAKEVAYVQRLILHASRFACIDILKYQFHKACIPKDPTLCFNEEGENPVYLACKYNHTAEALYLIGKFSHSEYNLPVKQRTPQHEAVWHNNVELVGELARLHPQDIVALDAERQSPLFYAARKGYSTVARQLFMRTTKEMVDKEKGGLPPTTSSPGLRYTFEHCRQRLVKKPKEEVLEHKEELQEDVKIPQSPLKKVDDVDQKKTAPKAKTKASTDKPVKKADEIVLDNIVLQPTIAAVGTPARKRTKK